MRGRKNRLGDADPFLVVEAHNEIITRFFMHASEGESYTDVDGHNENPKNNNTNTYTNANSNSNTNSTDNTNSDDKKTEVEKVEKSTSTSTDSVSTSASTPTSTRQSDSLRLQRYLDGMCPKESWEYRDGCMFWQEGEFEKYVRNMYNSELVYRGGLGWVMLFGV